MHFLDFFFIFKITLWLSKNTVVDQFSNSKIKYNSKHSYAKIDNQSKFFFFLIIFQFYTNSEGYIILKRSIYCIQKAKICSHLTVFQIGVFFFSFSHN